MSLRPPQGPVFLVTPDPAPPDVPEALRPVAVHPAALVLSDHLYIARLRAPDGSTKGVCECGQWRGWGFDYPTHLADMLQHAGLLADGPPPETPTTRVLAERADRRTT